MSSYTIPRYFANHYSKSPEQQEADIDKAVMEHPEDGELLLVMKAANYFCRPEKHEESMVLCERILKESAKPNLQHFAYWYAANLYFEDKQNYSKAEEYLLKLLELHPDATEAMIKIAEVNMAQKKMGCCADVDGNGCHRRTVLRTGPRNSWQYLFGEKRVQPGHGSL